MRITSGGSSVKSVLDLLGTVAFIVACAAIVWSVINRPVAVSQTTASDTPVRSPSPKDLPLPTKPISLEGAVTQGSRQAPVVIIEFSDFQCPYCGRFATETLPTITKQYVDTGKVLWAFRHFPLTTIHHRALAAASIAVCAAKQGKFWQLHDLLFANQYKLSTPDGLDELTRESRLNNAATDECLKSEAAAIVRADIAAGRQLGVSSTPTFFVGNTQADGRIVLKRRLIGTRQIGVLAAALDEQLTILAQPAAQ